MAHFIIESAGMLTTVQDLGRYGYQRFGMPVSGAMDTFSLQLANILVGNDPNDACLEITYNGPEITFISPLVISVTGAGMGPCINGKPVEQYKPIGVYEGDSLTFIGLRSGCRSYIAFSGGIDVPVVMGSRSTYLRGRLGGFEGRALRTGDKLKVGEKKGNALKGELPAEIIPEFRTEQVLRIIPGPEVYCFEMQGIRNFLNDMYTVTDQSDRMGYRLSGPEIKHTEKGADIISAGISPGTVQVPGNGQPILLMADRQTTGGYTRLANIISVDLTLASQLIPGNRVRFEEVTEEEARKLLTDRFRMISR